MIVSHWPTIMIGAGGESEVVSHFVDSIFSSSWMGGWGETKHHCTQKLKSFFIK
jgi:hypothetical protein